MNRRMLRTGLHTAMALCVVAGAVGTSTAAAAAPRTHSEAAAATAAAATTLTETRLWNLAWATQPTWPSGTVRVLKLQSPADSGTGEYFLFDPQTGEVVDFIYQGDMVIHSTPDWTMMEFPPRTSTTQVRFGNVDEPATAGVYAEQTVTRYRVTNLELGTQPSIGGGTVSVLKVAKRPQVPSGGVYYRYNPATGQQEGGFLVGGDMLFETVTSWTQAQFQLSSGSTEVRYGDPRQARRGKVVATATVL
ncbi:hypothetical protein [Couchioplanes caeruleus]|nr:hypothetical protein [Couchioplanes caeruleus]ROP32153.1 hypothetical protein EDD30_5084 [Couchioplanes caeruleus]